MPSLKSIRKRITSVKSTQKITRAMKMVAGARLNRAQRRISELRPYAQKTTLVLSEVTAESRAAANSEGEGEETQAVDNNSPRHPLLQLRPERHVLLVVMTSDRGLCGSFNASICKVAEQQWKQRQADGQKVKLMVVGRKGRDYFTRRGAPLEFIDDVWTDLDWNSAHTLGRQVLAKFLREDDPVDAIYLVYNEFKSAMTQQVVAETLLPVPEQHVENAKGKRKAADDGAVEFIFEPSEHALLSQLVPMYVQVSILRALYESMASELGARMTAMDSATNNANDMISKLTLQYNRARQAAITTELMEIISGSESLKG